MVITFAIHAKGLWFEPRVWVYVIFFSHKKTYILFSIYNNNYDEIKYKFKYKCLISERIIKKKNR